MVWLLIAGAGVYLCFLGALFAFQRCIVFRPSGLLPESATLGIPLLVTVQIPTEDGLSLVAWCRPPQLGQPNLLYFHGNGGSIAGRAWRIRRFAETGWGLLFLEYRGYGGNAGHPSEAGFTRDARAAADWLDRQGALASKLVLYGESIGTGVATRLAAERPVSALLLESPYTSIRAIAAAQYPWFPVRFLARDPFDLISRISAINAPVLIMQGGRDTIVPPAMGKAVFAAACEPKQLWLVPDAGHSNLMEHGAADIAIRFVQDHVKFDTH